MLSNETDFLSYIDVLELYSDFVLTSCSSLWKRVDLSRSLIKCEVFLYFIVKAENLSNSFA